MPSGWSNRRWGPWTGGKPWRCTGPREVGKRKTKTFSTFPIEELRDSLDFLLYDTIKLEGRFDECGAPDGAYTPPGAGKEFASYLLCLRQPRLLGVWNSNSERLLRRLGLETDTMKRGPIKKETSLKGIRYFLLYDTIKLEGRWTSWMPSAGLVRSSGWPTFARSMSWLILLRWSSREHNDELA